VLPVPSELVLIPAGYLAHQGQMNFWLVVLVSTVGSLVGASFNYVVAMWVGRPFLERWGRYFFVRPELLHKTDAFFVKHGAVSTFTGRLIPGIRHLISIPAGLARMNPGAFVFYTCLGAGLWSLVLTLFGYFLGDNEALIQQYQHHITFAVIVFVALVIGGYVWWQKRR
jgi:membrane protein DedA with SNARE-associated domain